MMYVVLELIKIFEKEVMIWLMEGWVIYKESFLKVKEEIVFLVIVFFIDIFF